LAEDWIATNCGEFIGKDEWPPSWMLTPLIIMSRTLQDISSQAEEH